MKLAVLAANHRVTGYESVETAPEPMPADRFPVADDFSVAPDHLFWGNVDGTCRLIMRLAVLSPDDRLVDWDDIAATSDPLPRDRVSVPPDCDLPLGKYRYDRDSGAFLPLAQGALEKIMAEPNALRAIWKGFRDLQRAGLVKFDQETVDWIIAYGKTVDAIGTGRLKED